MQGIYSKINDKLLLQRWQYEEDRECHYDDGSYNEKVRMIVGLREDREEAELIIG